MAGNLRIHWPDIVRDFGPVVWRTARRLLRNDADAADCFQQTFVSALKVAGRESVEHWPGLLQRLATARALDLLRQRMRHPALGDDDDLQAVPSRFEDPAVLAQSSELSEQLRERWHTCPPSRAKCSV
ncbi:MAG: sigma-70 family RNA polymerase sigma factor [Tepidisphaeraceae bacterium]